MKMKKFLIGFAFALGITSAQASYLYWQVTGTETWNKGGNLETALTDYTISSISVKEVGGGALQSYYYDGSLSQTANAADVNAFSKTAGLYVQAGTTAGTLRENYSYYIEIMGYETAKGSGTNDVIAFSTSQTYAEITQGRLTTELSSMASAVNAWTGTLYAAPEPTSGLLLLVGGALLALRRRRA